MGFWGSNLSGISGQIILYLQVLVAIFLSVHILLKKQEPQVCLGWLLAVAFSPMVALFFYLGVGINPFQTYSERKRRSRRIANQVLEADYHTPDQLLKYEQFQKSEFQGFRNAVDWVYSQSNLAPKQNIEWNLLINSNEVYDELYREIDEAKSSILVQFYQIQADQVGFAFLDKLAEKAKSGVEVYVVFDALGSFSLKTSMIEKYRESGIHFQRFLPIHPLKRRFQLNWRNHRKLVVLDGQTAFIGGFNIGELYLQGPNLDKPKWVDLLIKLKGSVVVDFVLIFFEDWHFTAGSLVKIPASTKLDISFVSSKQNVVSVIPSGPTETGGIFYETLLSVIGESTKKIWIMTPYFVPDRALLQALRVAKARGVDVKVVVPKNSNHPLTDLCASSYFGELLAYKIDVQRYLYGVCHAKLMIVDDDLLIMGSSNMDYRSFFLNFETDLMIRDFDLVLKVQTFYESVLTHCRPLSPEDASTRPLYRHIARRVMRLIAPLM